MASARLPRAEVTELVVLVLWKRTRCPRSLAEQGPQREMNGLAGASESMPTDDLLDQIAVNLDLDLLPHEPISTHYRPAQPAGFAEARIADRLNTDRVGCVRHGS
jgi:hypothetical protein